VKTTIPKSTPEPWKGLVEGASVDVVPLVVNVGSTHRPGWVSYDSTVVDSPDVEIVCGGINEKPSIGAAIWRQGHLLHFGFDLAPGEMNDVGRALLVNSIVYIARFREDRALCVSPSAFAGGVRARDSIAKWLTGDSLPIDSVRAMFAADATAGALGDRAELKAWFDEHRDWLRPDRDGKLAVDADAMALRLAYDRIEALEAAAAIVAGAAGGGPDSGAHHARSLLERYVPEGPAPGAKGSAWKEWLAANRPYLFFSEWGGYRWYVDALARQRGVPSASLRGPARADRPGRDDERGSK